MLDTYSKRGAKLLELDGDDETQETQRDATMGWGWSCDRAWGVGIRGKFWGGDGKYQVSSKFGSVA